MNAPCKGCGGTGEYWDPMKRDWGNVDCPKCQSVGVEEKVPEVDHDSIGERYA